MQNVITLDLEGVLIPEIWQLIAEYTHISELTLTTRDMKDYNALMQLRIQALENHSITIDDIQQVLSTLTPFEGAVEFLNTIRSQAEVILLSDTFIEFFNPLRKKLQYPTILCNSLNIDAETGLIQSYEMRMKNGKMHAVQAFQSICCKVLAAGDSYNDVSMLNTADYGVWFRPPESIVEEYPHMSVCHSYAQLQDILLSHL